MKRSKFSEAQIAFVLKEPEGGMTIARINQVFHASPPQIAAMLAGSMFGWEVPGADPVSYDAEGRHRRM